VSHSTGQPPDRFHFLRLPEFGLQLLSRNERVKVTIRTVAAEVIPAPRSCLCKL
jgi:hypothetical protein